MTIETSAPIDGVTPEAIKPNPGIEKSTLSFNELGLCEPILRAITDTGYTNPTPIQAKAIPLVLNGGDLLAGAQTGTGKTAGFTLPILHLLSQKPLAEIAKGRPRCLMLTPTRELAAQIEESVKVYGKHLPLTSTVIFGGVNINPQISRLKKPLDILVATPGRLLDHASQNTIDLSGVEILVLKRFWPCCQNSARTCCSRPRSLMKSKHWLMACCIIRVLLKLRAATRHPNWWSKPYTWCHNRINATW